MNERRKNEVVKSIALPVAVSLIVGAMGTYSAMQLNLREIEVQSKYMQVQLQKIEKLINKSIDNEAELLARGRWMIAAEKQMNENEVRSRDNSKQIQALQYQIDRK